MPAESRRAGPDLAGSSLKAYADHLERAAIRVVWGTDGTFWTRYESGALMRMPAFFVGRPPAGEIERILFRTGAGLATYLTEPGAGHPANAWLYVCRNRAYGLDSLGPATRRNVRRGLRELHVGFSSLDKILAHGVKAFCDTRRRAGLNDGTPSIFRRRFGISAAIPEHVFLGAWRDDRLAAFLAIREVEDWAEIECFSADAMLPFRPNDVLLFRVLTHYLVERRFRTVSFGVSSVQEGSSAAGLHQFKTKIGFEAQPVQRAFTPHPLGRFLVNRASLWMVDTALRVRPHDRRLRKLSGVLAVMLGRPRRVRTPRDSAGSLDEGRECDP